MIKFKVETGKKHKLMEIGYFKIDVDEIIADKELFKSMCKENCANYGNNGGCNPYAPDFNKIRMKYRNAVVVWIKLPTSSLPDVFIDGSLKHREFFCTVGHIQLVFPKLTNNIVKILKEKWNPDYYLGESECKFCKKCGFLTGEGCRSPQNRVFSLESTGVDVDILMRNKAFPLYWFSNSLRVKDIPYTVKVTMFMYKTHIPKIDFSGDIKEVLIKYDYKLLLGEKI